MTTMTTTTTTTTIPEAEVIMPPEPPTIQTQMAPSKIRRMEIGDGQFSYISCISERKMLINGWNAVTQTESWNYLSKHTGSVTGSNDPIIGKIYKKMEELGFYGHSGCSFACTIQNLKCLVKYGEAEFIKGWNKPR